MPLTEVRAQTDRQTNTHTLVIFNTYCFIFD